MHVTAAFLVVFLLQTGFVCLGILGLVAVNNPVTFAMVVPVIIAFVLLRNYFMKSSREVKRIEGISKKISLMICIYRFKASFI